MATTLANIAKMTGTSISSVTAALNGNSSTAKVSEDTKHRILEEAERLGYRRNELASSMVRGKSRLIGCLGLDPCEEDALYLANIMAAAVKEAAKDNYSIKLLSSESSPDELAEECFSYRMSGVIVRNRNCSMFDRFHSKLKKYHIPVVLVDTDYNLPDVTEINSDDTDGMRQIVEHLVELGHRRLGFIAFENYQPFTIVRRNSFLATGRKCGLALGEEACINTDYDENRHPFDRTEDMVMKLLTTPDRPTAIACNCDEIAMLVLRAALRIGMKVPEQLSVVGFGNLPLGVFAYPPLTSLERPYAGMGAAAIKHLLDGNSGQSLRLPVKLVFRQSTCSCPEPYNLPSQHKEIIT